MSIWGIYLSFNNLNVFLRGPGRGRKSVDEIYLYLLRRTTLEICICLEKSVRLNIYVI